ncbi:TonB family protein [Pacificibacter sp. AS14]|uniref:TonB family protein n=1 Tax=Pacificibacter sp. AS14 TaxID=3135785 RepID=UPI00316FA9D3
MRSLWPPAALGVSIALHVFGAGWESAEQSFVLDGGNVSGVVALGLGFEDLVKASVGAQAAPTPLSETVTPDTVVAATTPSQTATSQTTKTLTKASVPPALQSRSTPMLSALAPSSEAAQVTQKPTAASTPSNVKAQPVPMPTEASKPSRTPPEPRPTKAQAAPKPQKKLLPRKTKAGNAPVTARKGQASGMAAGTNTDASENKTKSTTKTTGDGAVRSYKTKVLRKIARVPKRSAGARGKAMVGITISPSGSISKALIVTSSGHAGIDKVAVAQVKRAGPFTPPPNGKSMNVVVRFDSAG